jgi:ribulose-5-phosphate 4-epimerase/fuculose-1-phosphate aldolase
MTDTSERTARIELAAALRGAAMNGLNEAIANHFSLALPGRDDRFLLNPFGVHWTEITASDLLTLDTDGRTVAGDGDAELTAFQIHLGVHRAHADARCVLHTHMPYATAIACTSEGFETRLSQTSMLFHGRVAYLDYGGRAESDAEGDRIAKALIDGARVVLMKNHGVLVVGETVAHAWWDLYYLERACQVQVLAAQSGKLAPVDEATAQLASRQSGVERHEQAPGMFTALRRQLDREMPGYDA